MFSSSRLISVPVSVHRLLARSSAVSPATGGVCLSALSLLRLFGTKIPGIRELGMPALSPTMTDGVISSWLKKEGDKVSVGEAIAEIETDKATMSFESQEEGYLAKILVPQGSSTVQVGRVIGLLAETLADVEKAAGYSDSEAPAAAAAAATPAAAAAPAESAVTPAAAAAAAVPSAEILGYVAASPVAKRLASEAGVDLSKLVGSGPKNRIVRADVEAAIASGVSKVPQTFAAPQQTVVVAQAAPAAPAATVTVAAPTPAAPVTYTSAGDVSYTDTPLTNIRRTIANRLTESKNTIPHYYLSMDVRVDPLLKIRQQLNDDANGEYKLSINDFIVKASAAAMRKAPIVNSTWMKDSIRTYKNVDISVAMDVPAGLITPIIRNVEHKGLASISQEVKELNKKAVAGSLRPEDYQGGTFCISNLGMFGIDHFTAIINPPQSCILAVGGVSERVIAAGVDANGQPKFEVAKYMTVTLSSDHRIVDGANGARWLQAFKNTLEKPLSLIL